MFPTFPPSPSFWQVLGVWGMIVVAGAIFASLGLSCYFGVDFTPVSTAVVPFLALGIGVDDMFVLLRAYAREAKDGGKAKHIMTRVIGEAGPSVLFTSFTNLGVCVCVSWVLWVLCACVLVCVCVLLCVCCVCCVCLLRVCACVFAVNMRVVLIELTP